MNRNVILFLTLPFLLLSCSEPVDLDEIRNSLTADRLMGHITILASDDMQGRQPGTPGEEKAVEYIAKQMMQIGLEPGMPDGTFLQPVPLMGQTTNHDSAQIQISRNGNVVHTLNYITDFMAWPGDQQEEIAIEDAELVYVGYGIQAPEENWDDFKDVDVAGKILVVKNFNPVTYADRFDGGIRLYYGRWSYKFEKAREMGALGALIIHTEPTAGYPWAVVSNSWSNERFNLMIEPPQPIEFEGWITSATSEKLFAAARLNFDDMLNAAEREDFRPIPLNNVTLSVNLEADYRQFNGTNVVGKITGSDRRLRDQGIMYSAHHDHLGATEDEVFNGAWDNASGTAAVLEMARALKDAKSELGRSVYFVTVTAEEGGLLGSRYFVENPPIHPANMAANINLDSKNIFGRTRDIVAIGYGRSDLDDILAHEAEKMDREVKPDQNPEQGFYYRSDHFNFARIGVPALYVNRGSEFIDYPEDYLDTVLQRTSEIYHTVDDEIYDWWDLRGAVEDLQLLFNLTINLSNQPDRPSWVEGDEFESARLQAIQEIE